MIYRDFQKQDVSQADKILPKDEILSVPLIELTLLINKFLKLRDEFKIRPMEGLKDQMEWLDILDKELGSVILVKEYLKWVKA